MDRAQVSFEYLTIIAIFMLISALVLVFSSLLFFNKEATKTAMSLYMDQLIKMMG
jgi:hypothetical protein